MNELETCLVVATHYCGLRKAEVRVMKTPLNPEGPEKQSGSATAWICSGEYINKLTTVQIENLVKL